MVVIANSYADFVSVLGDKIFPALLPGFAAEMESKPTPSASANPNPPAALMGRWTGVIRASNEPIPFTLEIGRGGSVRGQVGKQPAATLTDVSLDPSGLYGEMPGDPTSADATRHKYVLELNLFVRGNELLGAATLRPPPGQDGDELPRWVELRRAK